MHHPDIEAWLASRGQADQLRALERKAADAWFAGLTPEQREIYAALVHGHEGLYHLQNRIRRARLEAESNREGGVGFR